MTRFSFSSLLSNALTGNKNWEPQWPDAQPKAEYDVVIVGAGGHGLGAAYYLAKEHGITNVAVLNRSVLGNSQRIQQSFQPPRTYGVKLSVDF